MPKRQALIATIIVLLDRLTKWLVARNILLDDSVQVLPGFFRLTHLENPGAAFSFLADSPSPFKTAMLILFSLAALTVVLVLVWRSKNEFNAVTIALSLILGGATGNLWDRIVDGKVAMASGRLTTGWHDGDHFRNNCSASVQVVPGPGKTKRIAVTGVVDTGRAEDPDPSSCALRGRHIYKWTNDELVLVK